MISTFHLQLLAWYDQHGRKDLPWQQDKSPYRTWISEIMLQQTQVKTVIPYFLRFIERFPDVFSLNIACEDELFSYWSGLGYYQRARFIQKTATIIARDYQGLFPQDIELLKQLPGIGPSTAAAIASIAFNRPTAILDGNVMRVLSRYFLVDGVVSEAHVKKRLWALANQCMPTVRCGDYTQAIMDLGATCCTTKNPQCHVCPLADTCLAKQHNQVEEYPFKKQKKIRPIQSEQFLLLHTASNEIYLEKRPATGVWGNLWCLPSIGMDTKAEAYIQDKYGLSPTSTYSILSMKHLFTHFQLNINAIALRIETLPVDTSAGKWFKNDALSQLGLPKPVSTILASFSKLKLHHARIA